MRGEADTAGERVEPVLNAVADVQKDHESLRIEEIGGASMMKTFDDAFGDDFQKAEYSAVPVALGILLVAFGALVAALLPVLLAITAIMATMGLMGSSASDADERDRQLRDAAGGSGRRRRLLPVLPAP